MNFQISQTQYFTPNNLNELKPEDKTISNKKYQIYQNSPSSS